MVDLRTSSGSQSALSDMPLRIDDADDRTISRRIFSLEGKAGFFPAAPENQLAHSSSNRVNRHHRLARGLEIFVQSLYDEQFAPFQGFILDSRHYGANDSSKLHKS